MHPSLSIALASLDEYIEYLSGIRNQLAQGGDAEALVSAQVKRNLGTRGRPRNAKRKTEGGGSPRKKEVAQFLKNHGPSKRAEIHEGTKMPLGTLAYVLNDKSRFMRLTDGRWDLKAA
jgi:hypothetical protein